MPFLIKTNKVSEIFWFAWLCFQYTDSSKQGFYLICFYLVYGFRSSRTQMFFKTGIFKNFVKFTGKYVCLSLFLINFIKKRLRHSCFPVNFGKFLRTSFLQKTSGRLYVPISSGGMCAHTWICDSFETPSSLTTYWIRF